MPLFHYRAVSDNGEVQQGQLEVADEQAVLEQLRTRGLIPIEIGPQRGWQAWLQLDLSSLLGASRSKKLVILFTQHLASLLQSGVPLDRSLEIMLRVSVDAPMQQLISPIQEGVRRGVSLSRILSERPELFSGFYISMVQASEVAGDLAEGLNNLAYYLERSKSLRDRLVSALIYPVILLGVSVTSLLVILTYVIPQFRQLFDDMGAALPLSTQIVISVAEVLRGSAVWLLLLVLAAVWGWRQLLKQPGYRLQWDRLMLRLPLFGSLRQRIETARFARSLGTLLTGGVALLQALNIARQTLSNQLLVEQVGIAAESLKQGRQLAAPLLASGVFPVLALQMIQVGEETGRLDEMLLKVADTYDREVEVAIQRMLAILEPMLIVGLGVLIAGIILSVLVAIMSITEIPI
ncbi:MULTISPECIES: type II secretion system F family protein [unclassified Pseudomonas]|uniref:type II secretion system F family protein n=1 Tax=unclassified Pseudomonas TaxID=196821 RepID=UPI001EDED0D4|nr:MULTISPECIES: type II secretion system F family protein [unclassified Pseudomonas]MCG4452775.1 type II secretion system F family protein [Pseudomonas sp. MMS21 TM103]